MAKKITKKSIAKNMLLSVSAQVISLITSLIINLIVPKFIDEYQYSYWQTYILYASYVGLLHFGILDGIVLKFSEYDYDELDKNNMGFHFWSLVLLFSFFSASGIIIGLNVQSVIVKKQIILVSISILSKNMFMFFSYLFQITNRIKQYAFLVIRQRLFYGLIVIILMIFRVKGFQYYCFADICADSLGFIYGIIKNKEICFIRKYHVRGQLIELKKTAIAGVFLLIANFSSNFIVGSAKIIVQNHWSELTFGQVSFGFSITNLFLTFVMALSVVLFPALKRMEIDELPQMYSNIRIILTTLLLLSMVLYFPGSILLSVWLPNYKDSIKYAGILLPIIISSTKVSLLTNNYLKTFRKEKSMLIINVSCIAIEIIGLLICSYALNSLSLLLAWTVMITIIRSIISELVVSKLINKNYIMFDVYELILSIVFVYCASRLSTVIGLLIFGFLVLVYIVVNKKNLITSIKNKI